MKGKAHFTLHAISVFFCNALQSIMLAFTVPSENIHTPSLFPYFVVFRG
jgi:hypothetical protein